MLLIMIPARPISHLEARHECQSLMIRTGAAIPLVLILCDFVAVVFSDLQATCCLPNWHVDLISIGHFSGLLVRFLYLES